VLEIFGTLIEGVRFAADSLVERGSLERTRARRRGQWRL